MTHHLLFMIFLITIILSLPEITEEDFKLRNDTFIIAFGHNSDFIKECEKVKVEESVPFFVLKGVPEGKLRQEYQIWDLPMVQVYREGTLFDLMVFNKNNPLEISELITRGLMERVKELKTIKEFENFDLTVIAEIPENDEEILNKLKNLEKLFVKFVFGWVKGDQVKITLKNSDGEFLWDGVMDLQKFLLLHEIPFYSTFKYELLPRYGATGKDFCLVFSDEKLKEVTELKEILHEKTNVLHVPDFSRLQEQFGAKKPSVVITKGRDYYLYDGELSGLKEWAKNWIDGKIEPHHKSQPIPLKNDGPVKQIVYDNYDELVRKNNEPTLLLIHASWCGHCKRFRPIFEEFAKTIQSGLQVAEFEGSENDLPNELKGMVQGFPTTVLIDGKNIRPFSGDRTLKGLKEFTSLHVKPVFVKEDL